MENLNSISKEITEWEQSPYIEIGRRIQFSEYPLKHKDYQMRENLDRIKLPCYCTFEWRGKRRLGILENMWGREDKGIDAAFRLIEVDKQTNYKIGSLIDLNRDLAHLIKLYKINIGKVKLTYYETIFRGVCL